VGAAGYSVSSVPVPIIVGGALASAGCAVAFLPLFRETRTGITEAFGGTHRRELPMFGASFMGLLGGLGGYAGAIQFLSRIGSTNPVVAGIKTPFALFGALMGGQLSYHLAPNMYDGSRTLSLLLAFTADGLMADIL